MSVKKVRNGLQSQAGYDITPQKAASPLSTPCYSAPVYLPYIPTPILTAAQKAIDALITLRFDKVLAEKEAEANPPDDTGDDADDDIKAEDASDRTSVKADEEEDDDDDEGTVAYSVKAEDTENGIIAAPKLKRSASSLDEDARLAAELHAQWNGGRPSRHKKKAPKTTPKKRAGKKSEETVNSDVSDSGKAKKKKRKVNPNSPFNAPLILSEPLANFIGEPQVIFPHCSVSFVLTTVAIPPGNGETDMAVRQGAWSTGSRGPPLHPLRRLDEAGIRKQDPHVVRSTCPLKHHRTNIPQHTE